MERESLVDGEREGRLWVVGGREKALWRERECERVVCVLWSEVARDNVTVPTGKQSDEGRG